MWYLDAEQIVPPTIPRQIRPAHSYEGKRTVARNVETGLEQAAQESAMRHRALNEK